MFLEQINKRLQGLKDKMDATTQAPRQAAKKAIKKSADGLAKGAKTIGVKVEPKLYARILRYKEKNGISSMKRAVIELCDAALAQLKM